MKVTDAMVSTFVDDWGLDRDDYTDEEWAQHVADVRRGLEAALADVPEPWENPLWDLMDARLQAAEAKLAKVRQWRADFCAGRVDDFADLDEALDEKP